MIDSYIFGRMVIEGEEYQQDLIILPNGVILSSWWRKTGHQLELSDLKEVLNTPVKVLVVGTGQPGMMKPHPDLLAELKAVEIEVIMLPTNEAVAQYNRLRLERAGVAGCFHLTC